MLRSRSSVGTSAAAGASDDKIYPVPGIRLAVETPDAQPNGFITDETSSGEGSIPAGQWVSAAATPYQDVVTMTVTF